MKRENGRSAQQLRPISIEKSFLKNAHGSALIAWGATRVICSAMYSPGVPPFLEGVGKGWLTAEYAMLPASTPSRKPRELKRPDGRSTEIGRIIGRCLRSVVNLEMLCGYTVCIDCDVIDADGGTRTACITGAYVALMDCFDRMTAESLIKQNPLTDGIAAVSCGIVDGQILLDLDYGEDSKAAADINMVMSHGGGIIEIQGTGEKRPFSPSELTKIINISLKALSDISIIQKDALEK